MTPECPKGLQTIPQVTFSGEPIVYWAPAHTRVRVGDLAVMLPRRGRYGAAREWNVLQHTYLGLHLCKIHGETLDVMRAWACHDLHEAYLGDAPTQLKQALGPVWAALEEPWEAHVHRHFGFEWPLPPAVKARVAWIDYRTLGVEMDRLFHPLAHVLRVDWQSRGLPLMLDDEERAFRAARHAPNDVAWDRVRYALEAR